ncbi:GntR family transcriptional regulator [Streptomyces sp. NPDC088915]|uniref:GntR family transcriptional regulator n=1 Tax=Streptomyces sp. NPDC088915 TaxID=3365912 RepID=UPI00381504FE
MTADFEAAPDPQSAEPVGDPTLIRLRSDLAALGRLGKQYDTVSGGDTEGVLRLAAPWLPVAEGRLQAAEGSPADQARWRSLIDEVSASSEADFVTANLAARRLLRELVEAFLPGPSVREIADRVRRGIADGVLPPGTLLSRLRILADAGLTSASGTRVDLALQDLAADGLVMVRHSDQVLVAGRKACDQVTIAADLLRALVSTGVYPLMSSLPGQQDLSRLLAAERSIVSRALHRLHEEGYLSVQTSRRAVVRPVPPVPVSGPPTLEDLVGRLRSAAPSGTNLDRAGLRKSCRRAKTWQHRRSAPDAESLREVRQSLVAAAADLLPLAARRHPGDPDAHAVLGYTVTAALHDWPAEREIEVWRLACVATAVLDVLDLAGDAA